ncbi:MAG: Gfo/Idh/MocA family oxidoreductase [Gemmatimonadaceae bacterium]
MNDIRWGILGAARIAETQVVPALKRGDGCQVTAIASRDGARARDFANRLGIATSFGRYEALLECEEVDAVYIPLPNHLHVPWSIRALEHGKHVLCEKPIAMSGAEARLLQDATRAHPTLRVMEGFMYRFHPQWDFVRRLLDEGAIGTLGLIEAFFSYHNEDAGNIRNHAEMGGGALMDIGCYGVSVARWLYGAEPVRVMGSVERDPRFGTDRLTTAILEFEDGMATVACATQLAPSQRVHLVGTKGRIEIDLPFNGPLDLPRRVRHIRGGVVQEHVDEGANQFVRMGERFAHAARHLAPVPTPLSDAVANMDVIDAVLESARENAWVSPCGQGAR